MFSLETGAVNAKLADRPLTGGDFDPESFRRATDERGMPR